MVQNANERSTHKAAIKDDNIINIEKIEKFNKKVNDKFNKEVNIKFNKEDFTMFNKEVQVNFNQNQYNTSHMA